GSRSWVLSFADALCGCRVGFSLKTASRRPAGEAWDGSSRLRASSATDVRRGDSRRREQTAAQREMCPLRTRSPQEGGGALHAKMRSLEGEGRTLWRVFGEDPAPGADLEACGQSAVHDNYEERRPPRATHAPGIEAAI